MDNRRIFVEKRPGFRVEAESLRKEFNENLGLSLHELRLLNVYDLAGFSDGLLEKCRYAVFGETVTDTPIIVRLTARNTSPWNTFLASSTSVPPPPWTASI